VDSYFAGIITEFHSSEHSTYVLFCQLLSMSRETGYNTAQVVRASDCDWTIVRVSMLTNAPKTGIVKVGHVGKAMGMRLSRADLAEFMLEQVQDAKYLRQAPAISN
jgi:hypothetical protein